MKKIIIKSDYETLEFLHKTSIHALNNPKNQNDKRVLRYFLILSISVIVSYILTELHQNFIVLTALATMFLIPIIGYAIYKQIKFYLNLRQYNSEFQNFAEKYKGLSHISYILFEDKLEYLGHERMTIKWSEFINLAEDENSFILNHRSEESTIWIPKIATTNDDDFEDFKNFAKQRIKNEPEIE